MRRLPRIPLALVLLAIPAIFFAWVAVRFVRSEAAQTDALVVEADRSAVEAGAAAALKACVTDARREVERLLLRLPERPRRSDLAVLSDGSPWVRNTFYRTKRGQILHPVEKGATQEERRFLARYVTLFDEGFGEPPAPPAKLRTKVAFSLGDIAVVTWRPWFEGDRLSFIGWRWLEDGSVVGAELETIAFLAAFPELLDEHLPEGLVLAVRDGDCKNIFQTAAPPETPPAATISLAPVLPHREIAVWRVKSAVGQGSRTWFYLAMAGVLFLFFVIGGWLLVAEARRERLDARRKTMFVSNVSHELKTPLTSIRLFAEMLSGGRIRDEAARVRYLDVIVKECGRLTRLVDNVLDFGRLEQNRRRFELAEADLSTVACEAAESQRSRVEEAGMVLTVTPSAAPAIRRIDRDAVSQVVVNLIDNAVKYASSGRQLEVSVAVDGRVAVADRGPGIAAKHRARIFERFYRCDDSLTAKSSGSGLGLCIAKRLVEEMGGDLRYEPRPGGGARFVIDFGGKA